MPPRSLRSSLLSANTAVGALFILGAFLRIWGLGSSSFWLDEAGVAYAARMPTLAGMLEIVRSHVMAMPLDYLMVWLFGRFSYQEAVLRLPAVIWGISSLPIAYLLFRKTAPEGSAILGMLFLALSPLHIQYSQELRFYSSLVFFYLLSTLLLLNAIQAPTTKKWVFFTVIHIAGIYFHPYVLLAWVNGLVWILQQNGASLKSFRYMPSQLRVGFLAAAVTSLTAFLVGYRLFSAGNYFVIPLMVFEDQPAAAIAAGLGWLPIYFQGLQWGLLWGVLCAVLELSAMAIVIHQASRSLLAGLAYSLSIQVLFIIASDVFGHYFFAPRQFLMLLPMLCLFAGVGAQKIYQAISYWIGKREAAPSRSRRIILAATCLCLVILSSLPAIALYRQDDKGSSHKITEIIASRWKTGDLALVMPSYDGFVYKYYLEWVDQRADISTKLYGTDEDAIAGIINTSGNIYLITPQRLSLEQMRTIESSGYQQLFYSAPQARYAKILWMRENTSH